MDLVESRASCSGLAALDTAPNSRARAFRQRSLHKDELAWCHTEAGRAQPEQTEDRATLQSAQGCRAVSGSCFAPGKPSPAAHQSLPRGRHLTRVSPPSLSLVSLHLSGGSLCRAVGPRPG